MKYFNYLSTELESETFHLPPSVFTKDSEKDLLAISLGATLYMPGTKGTISYDIVNKKHEALISLVICLEDSIGDNQVEIAEVNTIKQIENIAHAINNGYMLYEQLPLIFIRIRNPEQMQRIADALNENLNLLTGFVFPKFSYNNGIEYLTTLKRLNDRYSKMLYGMPILETKDVLYKELRDESLFKIKALLDHYYDYILNVRMGATDLSGLYGLRRSSDTTIYDIAVIRDCIADIINVFGRSEKEYIISGPVWEYFFNGQKILKPQLRQYPFERSLGSQGIGVRKELIDQNVDGLIREVLLDLTNGLIGKTIIHPTHIKPVQSLHVVSLEEYLDATNIVESANGNIGVIKSEFSNKMNEVKPHFNWATKILNKSKIYGVFHNEHNYTNLFIEQIPV